MMVFRTRPTPLLSSPPPRGPVTQGIRSVRYLLLLGLFFQPNAAVAWVIPTVALPRNSFLDVHYAPPKRKYALRRVPCQYSSGSSVEKSDSTPFKKPRKKEDEPRDGVDDDDAALLKTVTKQQLVELCQQLQLPTQGTKVELLQSLRQHAEQMAQREHERHLDRVRKVEEGTENSKERYEILDERDVQDSMEEDEVNGYFYFSLPDTASESESSAEQKKPTEPSAKTPAKTSPFVSNTVITAPPPPDQVNSDGERVVTIYSTTEQNDLTGVAAAQPGLAAATSDNLADAGPSSATSPQPWEAQPSQQTISDAERGKAKEEVSELVLTLLAMSGAPAFLAVMGQDDLMEKVPSYVPPKSFVGFHPGLVPTELLDASSRALRLGRGQVLQEVLRAFELQAIGQDGMAGDNTEKGGGYYREVAKIGAFLEGYRRAEVRKLARETTALLLDKLVLEGVDGLDLFLASTARTSDDTGEQAGELNDSLLDYLNDAIRQQQNKVDQQLALGNQDDVGRNDLSAVESDVLDEFWNASVEDGKQVETINPDDPRVRKLLEEEYAREQAGTYNDQSLPDSGAEKLLLLLRLLRERIKAEAAFAPDETGRNLRLLAYCLRLTSAVEREQMIRKKLGNSLDRLDSFIELVASSVEYSESTSHQLQPSKSGYFKLSQLRMILDQSQSLRLRQSERVSRLG